MRFTGTFKEKFHVQSKILTGIFSQQCHARFHGQIYENQKMSRVLFDIVTDICAVGAKKRVYIAPVQVSTVLFFSLMSRAFINVTPFFTEFVKGNFFCHGRKCAIFVTGKILRHGRFFPRLSWARKKVSRMKEKNTGKNICKNLGFFSGISV